MFMWKYDLKPERLKSERRVFLLSDKGFNLWSFCELKKENNLLK